MKKIQVENVSKVLVIGLSCIGDMLFTTAALRNLRHFLPEAEFTLWAPPRVVDMFIEDPMWNCVKIYDRKSDFSGVKGRLKALHQMRQGKFDLIIDLRETFMPLFSGAPYAPFFAIKEFFFPTNVHEVEKWLHFFSSIGVSVKNRNMRLYVHPHKIQEARNILRGQLNGRAFFILNPSADSSKRWPIDSYARLAKLLIREYQALIGVIGFGEYEKSLAQKILSELDKKDGIDLSGNMSLSSLAAWIACADLMVSNDTGPLHMAASLSVPVVGIYGPSLPEINGPWGTVHRVVIPRIPCAPCKQGKHCHAGVGSCLSSLTVSEVFEACSDVLIEAQGY